MTHTSRDAELIALEEDVRGGGVLFVEEAVAS